jgi:hypothetical protein
VDLFWPASAGLSPVRPKAGRTWDQIRTHLRISAAVTSMRTIWTGKHSNTCLITNTTRAAGTRRLDKRPSPYHLGARRSIEVVDAGQKAHAGRMRSTRADAVAALCSCTTGADAGSCAGMILTRANVRIHGLTCSLFLTVPGRPWRNVPPMCPPRAAEPGSPEGRHIRYEQADQCLADGLRILTPWTCSEAAGEPCQNSD